MNPYTLWIAVIAAMSFAAIFPATYWFLGEYAPQLPLEAYFMANVVPMAIVLLFAVSWWGEE